MSAIRCPHCGREQVWPEEAGRRNGILDCPHCQKSFVRPGPSQVELRTMAESASPLTELGATANQSPSEVGLGTSAPIAVAATLLFYLLLKTPLGSTYFGQLYSARGWVPYVIAFFSLWAIAILLLKYRLYRKQCAIQLLDLLPASFGKHITASNASVFSSYLQHITSVGSDSYLVERLDWGLRRFIQRRNINELTGQLAERTRADADAIDSSYSMLRVFVWAIPILGFIGTVVGISEAVGSFSYSVNSAASLEVMRESIGSVTTGLGVAFDTTLLALVMSILIMFPMSSLQKAEEDLLARGEAYCDRQLIGRLREIETPRVSRGDRAQLLADIEQLEARIRQLEPQAESA
jgi:biopolymer transport protein ExbB/TolQ